MYISRYFVDSYGNTITNGDFVDKNFNKYSFSILSISEDVICELQVLVVLQFKGSSGVS